MNNKGIQLIDSKGNKVYPNPFPIGAIYMSVDQRNPNLIFGGTWEQIKGRFLIGADENYSIGSTGGLIRHKHKTRNHTLSIEQIPPHTHPIKSGYGDTDSITYDSYRYQYWGHSENSWKNGELGAGHAGGGQAHNHGDTEEEMNLPPYFAVYIWKRIS